MILRTQDVVVKVHFRHYRPDGKGGGLAKWPSGGRIWWACPSRRPMTECLVHFDDCRLSRAECEKIRPVAISSEPLYPGEVNGVLSEAKCSPRDIFTKVMGRRISLGRALKRLAPKLQEALMADYERQIHKA